MNLLRSIYALDQVDYFGPKGIPALVRHSKKGRDGRLNTRWLCGRYPRVGGNDQRKVILLNMAKAEAKEEV